MGAAGRGWGKCEGLREGASSGGRPRRAVIADHAENAAIVAKNDASRARRAPASRRSLSHRAAISGGFAASLARGAASSEDRVAQDAWKTRDFVPQQRCARAKFRIRRDVLDIENEWGFNGRRVNRSER